MTRLEQIEFDNNEKFNLAIAAALGGKDVFKTYKDKDGNDQKKKIISKNRIYLGNNISLRVVEAENKKIYLSVEYFSLDDRFSLAKNKSEKIEEINF